MIKTIIKRTAAAVMVAVMILTMTTGCKKDPESDYVPPEFLFVPEFISIPDGVQDIGNLVYAGDKVYFTSYVVLDEVNYRYTTKLYSMDIDGTNLKELPNYDPGNPFEDAQGGININALRVDTAGNLWVYEAGYFFRINSPGDKDYDTDEPLLPEPRDDELDDNPDGDITDEETGDEDIGDEELIDDTFGVMPEVDPDDGWYGEWEDLGEVMTIRKLDSTGAEILALDMSHLAGNAEYFYISTLNIDDAGNIYLAASAGDNYNIYVLSNDGNLQFKLDVGNWIDSLIRMPDGSIAVLRDMETADGWSRALVKIDYAAKTWGSTVDIPRFAWQVFQGGGDYDIVFIDNNNLKGVESATGESVKLLNWLDSGVINDNIQNITILPDGRIMCTSQTWDRRTYESNFELIILTKVPYSELPEKTVLTLATVWLDWNLRSHIVQFNRSNPDYRIAIIDYSEFNTEDDWGIGLTRLSTDIIAGRVPDMLDVSNLPFKQYVTRGLLEDIYEYIDADPQLDRSDFIENAFRVAELNGGLYRIFPSFYVSSLVGSPRVLGEGTGWNMEEFKAVLSANPQADMPIGQWLVKSSFLSEALTLGMDQYVDWAAGTAKFNSDDFIQLLEFANTFPAEFTFDYDNDVYIEEYELIAQGRQIMSQIYLSDFNRIQWYSQMFGGDIVFKGFPTENRNGNSLIVYSGLAITSRCTDKDGAWEFMRTFLSADWQRENIDWSFPTNKAAFDAMLKDAMTEKDEDQPYTIYKMDGAGMEFRETPVTQQEADRIIALINSVSSIASYDEALMNIVMEGANDYFSGLNSAQDAARIIQSRASIYIAEQRG